MSKQQQQQEYFGDDDGGADQLAQNATQLVRKIHERTQQIQLTRNRPIQTYQTHPGPQEQPDDPQYYPPQPVIQKPPAKYNNQPVNKPANQPANPSANQGNQGNGQVSRGSQGNGQGPRGNQGNQGNGQGPQNDFGKMYGMFQERDKSDVVINPLLQSMYNQNKIEGDGYQVGKFVQFAQKIERKVNYKQNLIKKIVAEAVYSYEKRIKENQKKIQQLLNFEASNTSLIQQFGSQQKMREYMNDQLGYVYRETQKDLDNFSIMQTIKKQYSRKKTLISSAQVDGKFISIKKLRLKQRFYQDRFLYLPTTVQGIYVRLDPKGKLYKVKFDKGTFFDKRMLEQLSQNMKQQIIGMVLLYLKTQEIIVEKSSTQDLYHTVSSFIDDIRRKQLGQYKRQMDNVML